MVRAFGDDVCYVSTTACRRSQAPSSCMSTSHGWINCGQAGPLAGPCRRHSPCAQPIPAQIVALSGDYDFQFMLEELAVGAQFKLP